MLFNPLNVHYVSVGICQRDKDSRIGVKGGKDTDRYGDLDFEPPGFVKIFMFFMSRADIWREPNPQLDVSQITKHEININHPFFFNSRSTLIFLNLKRFAKVKIFCLKKNERKLNLLLVDKHKLYKLGYIAYV